MTSGGWTISSQGNSIDEAYAGIASADCESTAAKSAQHLPFVSTGQVSRRTETACDVTDSYIENLINSSNAIQAEGWLKSD